MSIKTSTPSLSNFNPLAVKWQAKVISDIRKRYDYSDGFHEVLLSGSVGSSKTTLLAHLVVTHCLMHSAARVCLGRYALPDLKATLFNKIKEHIGNDLRQGIDYWINDSTAYIKFSNGSEILSRSWADTNFTKVRSLELSMVAIEEGSESDDDRAYTELSMRVNRLPHVPEQLIVVASNPDGPRHWLYKHFMLNPSPTRHVYYSITSDNPFLPKSYINKLKEDLDPKMVDRMIYGKWVDVAGETIYYQYDSLIHYKDDAYTIDKTYPVHFTWDFNVGEGKPLSVAFFQYINDTFHFFDEVVIEGLRTEAACTEIDGRGLFDLGAPFLYLHGDATGAAGSSQSNLNNYEIIKNYLNQKKIAFKYGVLPSNPPIKTRHNLVNAYLKNADNQVRLFVYGKKDKRCRIIDEGLRLTKLKKGASYSEDDSKAYQHITTAVGYGVYYCNTVFKRLSSSTIQL